MNNDDETNEWAIGRLCEPRACKAPEGHAWLKRAYKIFFYQPFAWMMVGFFIFMVSVIGSSLFGSTTNAMIKILGGLIVVALVQLLSAGLLAAAHRCEQDHRLDFSWIFLGFRKWLPLIMLSFFYFVMVYLIDRLCQFLLHMYGSGSVEKILVMTDVEEIKQALAQPGVQTELVIYTVGWMALVLLFSMLICFAPALIIFHDVPVLEAIKSSIIGFIRNIRPFAVYGLVLIGVAIALSVVIAVVEVLLLMVLGEGGGKALVLLLCMLLILCLFVVVYLSVYTAYRDIFWLRENEFSA